MSDQKKNTRIAFITLGCRVNQYESDALAGILEKDGFSVVPFGEMCDITVVNTCTVTAESDRKSRQHIRRAAAANPRGHVIVTGCFAQISPESAAKIPGVAAVIGNADKGRIIPLIRDIATGKLPQTVIFPSDMEKAGYDTLSLPVPRRARAYIKIEDGCENRCSYCIIPAARGKIRSKIPGDVLAEATALTRAGCAEITLTGIETAAYGRDSGGTFTLSSLICDLAKVDGIRRIGLGSLDPSLMRNEFLHTIASVPALLPHFHLSLQSGSSSVLRRMRRPYNAEMAMDRIQAVRRLFPAAMLTADVIVGFPGETEEEFAETVRFCEESRFLHLHIFPYSVRKGTEAAGMNGQIPDVVKKARVAHLTAIQKAIKAEILQQYTDAHKDKPIALLIEEFKDGNALGHSEHFVEICVPAARGGVGDIVPVYLTETDGQICRGIIGE